jgi:hypothetical protein
MKIDFQFQTKYGTFRDALSLPDDHDMTSEKIIEMQINRLNNWMYLIENPPEPEIVDLGGVKYEKVVLDGQTLLKPIES